MARRGRNRRLEQRDDFSIANFVAVPSPVIYRPVSVLSDDRRAFHPDHAFRPVFSPIVRDRDVIERYSRVRRGEGPPPRPLKEYGFGGVSRFGFRSPRQVSLCVRRHRRREVLFAMRKTGRGARSVRRRNYWSDVKC